MSIKSIKGNRGFTLLEALIGFLILSIGMLGIASLQAVSLKAGKTSAYSAVALMKVEELFESMRANPNSLDTYAFGGVDNGCSGTSTKCKEAELAQDDVFWWKKNLKAGLPGAATTVVTVTPAVAPSKMATVKIDVTWSERDRDSATSKSKTYTTTSFICTEIPC